jgi:mRNA interferase RelE/StbE
MNYHIEFSHEAVSDIDVLFYSDKKLFKRILNKIEFLSAQPMEGKPLAGNHKGEFSLRVGDYRLIYELDSVQNTIYILTIKHRKHVY